jgi:hypothetical protein
MKMTFGGDLQEAHALALKIALITPKQVKLLLLQ